jgi:3-methyladenine DNA glycosylase Tag
MSAQPAKPVSAWFDEASHHLILADKARRAETFVTAMADGKVDEAEIKAQERRLVALMEEVEPQLDAALHAKVTNLLCELTVYNFMQAMVSVQQARPKSVFRG